MQAPNCFGGSDPVHLRHLNIHQHKIEDLVLDRLHRCCSIRYECCLVTASL